MAQVIGRTLGYLSPLIFFRLVYPLSPYSAGAIDAVIISVIVGVLILAFAFTFNSLYNRFFRW